MKDRDVEELPIGLGRNIIQKLWNDFLEKNDKVSTGYKYKPNPYLADMNII